MTFLYMRVAIVLLMLIAGTAHAGLDCDEAAVMKSIERFAKNKKATPDEYDFLCLSWASPKLKPRIERACTAIMDRDGAKNNPCIVAVAQQGIAKLGDHDIFAGVLEMKENPIESSGGVGYTKTQLLGMMGDVRGAKIIVDEWTAAIPKAAAREKKKREMASWSGWRQRAAEALGKLGGESEATFLEEQAAATKDKHVKKACLDAKAAIEKRLATK
jgi:hypothetical protein